MSSALGSKEKILVCARELFYFVGYQTTSVDDILRICGVAKSNFYYHFRTKEELALAVLDLQIAEFEVSALRILTDRQIAPPTRLKRFCDGLVEAQSHIQEMGGCPFGNFAASLSSRGDDERIRRFREVMRDLFGRIQRALETCVQDGVAAGQFRDDLPPEDLACMALAAIEGLMLITKTQRDTGPLRQGLLVLHRLLCVH